MLAPPPPADRWNALHATTTIESPQSKPSKLKYVPFVAGPDRHSDWLLDFGDHLTFDRGSTIYKKDEKTWLLPELSEGAQGSAGTKLSSYIKALQPTGRPGAVQKYAHVAVSSLPPQPTAAGFRPGAADTLAVSVPAEIAVHTTGHDLKGMSALWNYLESRIALCIAGAIALSGWRPLPYGQLGEGPVHPSLQPILDGGETLERLERMIDLLFSLHDASPPMLLKDGALRTMMHATFATMIMYYEERFRAQEMHVVLAQMREAYWQVAGPRADANGIFTQWGALIKSKFDIDNLHLTGRKAHDGDVQIIQSLRQLATVVSSQHAQLSDTNARVMRLEAAHDRDMERLLKGVNSLSLRAGLEHGQPRATFAANSAAASASQSAFDAATAAAATAATAAATSPTASEMATTEDEDASPRHPPGALPPALAPANLPPAPMPPMPAPPPRPPQGDGTATQEYSLSNKLASAFYYDCMTQFRGNLPPLSSQRTSDAAIVLGAFKAMTIREERAVLLATPLDQSHAQRIVQELSKLVLKRILDAYRSHPAKSVPARLANSTVLVNTVCENLKKSELMVDSTQFQSWRSGASGSSSSQPSISTALGKRPADPPPPPPEPQSVARLTAIGRGRGAAGTSVGRRNRFRPDRQ